MAPPIVTKYPADGFTPGLVVVCGSFAPNGSSAVSSSSVKGIGFTVARTATGVFTVTLKVPITDVVSMQVDRTENTAGTFLLSPTPYSTSARTFTIKCTTPAAPDTAADVTAHANNRISFTLMCKTVKGTR